jgi:hypothetical protein
MNGLVGIYLLFCPIYDTAHCAVKDTTLLLEPKVCGLTSKGFDRATNQAGRMTVKCRR